ncbi:MAG: hypothetical protein MUC50_22270 [Myxococcota bacterium]|jgi:hypothetical protein|nr:hypothetical protein [Myxococcota bacterium]
MTAATFTSPLPQVTKEWTLSFLGGFDPSALIVLSLSIIAGVIWTWRALDPSMPLRIRLSIAALRTFALLLAFAMLLQPTLRLRASTFNPARVAVLLDGSGSMRRGVDGPRLDKAIAMASRMGEDLKRRGSAVEWYCFTDELQAISDPKGAAGCAFESRGTDLRTAIAKTVANENRVTPLSALVVLSDGADTTMATGNRESDLSGWASTIGAPINTIAVTGASARRDIAVAEARTDRIAFTRTPTSILVSLSAVGANGESVEVHLLRDGAVVRRGNCEIVDGAGRLTFSFTPISIGEHVLEVALSPTHQDEIPENDRTFLSLSALRDKYRVLHLAGRPSWDQRFLRGTLKDWPKMDLVSFYVLRSELQSETHGSSGMVLIPFPTEELFASHLPEFDVVIVQDLDLVAVGIDQYLPRISEFVQQGGGLVYIVGPAGLPPTISADEAMHAILPFVPLPVGAATVAFETAAFRPQILPNGRNHPLLALAQDTSETQQVWQSLPQLEGLARVARLAPTALALAGHPSLFVEDGPAPLFTVRDVAQGRSLAITTPSLWRWGFSGPMTGGPSHAYSGFWHRAIAWLTKDASLDRLKLLVAPNPAKMGGTAVIEVEVLDEAYQPIATAPVEIAVTWTNSDKSRGVHEVKQSTDGQGKYRFEWMPTIPGPHKLTVVAPSQNMQSQSEFLVLPSSEEVQHLEPRTELLEALAKDSGGTFQQDTAQMGKLAGLADSRNRVVSSRDLSLWSHPVTILLLLAVLGAEWLLRRRSGLW